MTVRYVGIGGSDSNDGLSWANRKLTLNGAEDTPVVAGDIVYVGPGTYREQLTCDVSGSSGNAIVYIADITGKNTDGVGGIVRITGSDNDETGTRASCIAGGTRDYRTFRGFLFDGSTGSGSVGTVDVNGGDNWIVEDCCFGGVVGHHVRVNAGTNLTVRRCISYMAGDAFINFSGTTVQNGAHVIENSIIIFSKNYCIRSAGYGGITVRGCVLNSRNRAVEMTSAPPGGYTTITVERCQLISNPVALAVTASGEITEDYNNFWNNATDRGANVGTGANSVAKMPGFAMPLLVSGYRLPPPIFGELAPHSVFRGVTGGTTPTEDMLGMTRPATASKTSWGPFQHTPGERDTTDTYNGSADSLELPDAGFSKPFIVEAESGKEVRVSVWVKRQANYGSANYPRLIVREPGQSDRTAADTGSASVWNELAIEFTPAYGWFEIILESRNTATSGSYAVFFDKLTVSDAP